jgi:hypothetical protein
MIVRRALPVLAALAILSSACFNEPVTPPDPSSADARLLGEWDCRPPDPSADERALLTVLRFDAGQYYAEWKEGEKLDRYRAYPGALKGLAILNVAELSDKYWVALRASFSADGSMSLAMPAKRIIDLTDDDVRLRTFRHEGDQPTAWQGFALCVPHKD